MRSRVRTLLAGLLLLGLSGCQYYADYRLKQTQSDIQEERAELMKAHRECLKKYEGEPHKSPDFCTPCTQSPRGIDLKSGR